MSDQTIHYIINYTNQFTTDKISLTVKIATNESNYEIQLQEKTSYKKSKINQHSYQIKRFIIS